jgi:hypothetical protein
MWTSVPNLADAQWRKSSRSGGQGQCVEVARGEGWTAIRDSKNADGPALVFSVDQLDSLLRNL